MKVNKITRRDTALKIASDAIKQGLSLHVETLWYGYGLMFTAGPYRQAVGGDGYAVFCYGAKLPTEPFGQQLRGMATFDEVVHWIADHARIPDIRAAIKKATKER